MLICLPRQAALVVIFVITASLSHVAPGQNPGSPRPVTPRTHGGPGVGLQWEGAALLPALGSSTEKQQTGRHWGHFLKAAFCATLLNKHSLCSLGSLFVRTKAVLFFLHILMHLVIMMTDNTYHRSRFTHEKAETMDVKVTGQWA